MLRELLYINELDAYTTYGVFLSEDKPEENKNYSALFKPAKAKPLASVDFIEDNGKEYGERVSVAFDERTVELRFTLEADSKADFLSKYSAFITALRAGDNGWVRLRLADFNKTFNLLYDDCSEWSQLTNFEGRVYASFRIKFIEPQPTY